MFTSDPKLIPPTIHNGAHDEGYSEDRGWMNRARTAYQSSTNYFDGNFRKPLEDSIRAFNNQHPSESKYNSALYDKRSKIYRPKIRSVMRKNEAAAAAAFFSNMDVVSLTASDQTDKVQLVSADIMRQLLQYRLTKSIPWYQTVLGGLQDAQVAGVTVARVYWHYDAASKIDKPCVDLIPLENFRFDPAANWTDVVNTSPYLIELVPMWHMDIQEKIDSGEWFNAPIHSSNDVNSTKMSRGVNKEDPQSGASRSVQDYDICIVQRHIHRRNGTDWLFYTFEDQRLLSDPVPLETVVFHGKRDYVVGSCILETHKVIPSGVPTLAKGIIDEVNEVANQRIDNVKFALNRKWFVKRGAEVDAMGLVRNVPGGVIMMNDPINDVREITWPDVTSSAYMEQQGLDLLTDELLGNFNPAALMSSGGAAYAPARNMAMLNQSTGTLVEYLIRTYVETFVQPVLRHLILLEQYYESDRVILGIAAKNSQMFQRFGVDQVTDELLMQEITLTVNVGMGATDPTQKLQKFLTAMSAYTAMLKNPSPGINMNEVGKEIFGHLGYSDGSRFFTTDNPQVTALQQQLMKAMQVIQQMQMKLKEKETAQVVGLQKTRETNATKIQVEQIKQGNENRRDLAKHHITVMTKPNERSGNRTSRTS